MNRFPTGIAVIDQINSGGREGIRTPDTVSGIPVFKTGAFNHSATLPLARPQVIPDLLEQATGTRQNSALACLDKVGESDNLPDLVRS